MERIRTALLVAAAAIISLPAVATAQNDDHHDRRGGHQQARVDQSGQRGQFERPGGGPAARPQVPQARPAPGAERPQRNFERRPDVNRPDRPQPSFTPAQRDQRRDFQRRDNDDRSRNFTPGGPRQFGTPAYNGSRDERRDRDRARIGDDRHDRARPNWDNRRNDWNRDNWRNDRRYDWRSYRNQHGNRFRLPRYVPPRGYSYGYRFFSPGLRIDPFFYGQTYWIADPWDYRLPPAYGSYRWVRYYNDALLVDIRSGIVVDVIRDFFY